VRTAGLEYQSSGARTEVRSEVSPISARLLLNHILLEELNKIEDEDVEK
jgi:hypothetical protein